ncbi:maleylpyruvate isomerase family mycothiol-dependent enzyme [Mycobacterium spongiae]|uniref:Maleylpyruvate isomerase family mycothiol-dependent enzyme n=1 Tax=Mycobacterium spongiae TaxID=886343 RepID=A0A975JZY7_9MYCO|nr:maleylpyruvate isomerase family mycothiol-dependent enzyme [Mycobacterium spongiae]QUR68797.1 maleylpyruvate isomerase family mycothiol-dependent enzyme [Mycobacterium spongiae]
MANSAEARLDRLVPSCPGWEVADLIWHVGTVQAFWGMTASGSITGPDAWREPDRPQRRDLVAWFRDGVDLTANILGGLDPDTPAWTWGRRKTVGFIQRRVAQETVVHCWDALTAVGCQEPVEQELAVDGVDEFLDEVLPNLSHDLGGHAQTISLRTSDSADEWTVRVGEGSYHLTRFATKATEADAAVIASASELLLLLWGRRDVNQVAVEGELAALKRFLARTAFDL